MDLLVNGTPLARGEVVIVDEQFGLRVTEIVEGDDPAAPRLGEVESRGAGGDQIDADGEGGVAGGDPIDSDPAVQE